MPERDLRLRIDDIAVAIDKIERYTVNMTLADFQADERTVDAVLRNFEVIGEAVRKLPGHVTEANPNIPWAKMCALRNVVAHAYFGVNLPIIWETIVRRLPELKAALESLKPSSN
jgi:uncharacterized protein with HEPN domain